MPIIYESTGNASTEESTGNASTEDVGAAIGGENSRCLDNTIVKDADTYFTSSEGARSDISYNAGEFQTVYDGKWYVGEIQNVAKDDQDRKENKIWVLFSTFPV